MALLYQNIVDDTCSIIFDVIYHSKNAMNENP